MRLDEKELQAMLVAPGFMSRESLEEAAREATTSGKPLESVIIEKGLLKESELGQIVASNLGFPFAAISREHIDEDIFNLIPPAMARARGAVAIERTERGIRVGMTDPRDTATVRVLEKKFGEPIIPNYITERSLDAALLRYDQDLLAELKALIEKVGLGTLSVSERESTTVGIVTTLLLLGHKSGASDIHIEPHRGKLLVRTRIDGVMHDIVELSKDLADLIVTRVKVLSELRTDEHQMAQDGKFRFDAPGESVDVRVSIMPVTEGENLVMRLLASHGGRLSIADLGFSSRDRAIVERVIKKPHGMILATGPTGAGKTTTLYAILQILNRREVHIATIEDPVEYSIEGISQIQVNTQTNLTFAKGLRALVRQDPDIIMVGEIRDNETAEIAVNAAMTGHLVLSTLHANDAATTLPRLIDMQVEPFLIASSMHVVIGQRLVRTICGRCRASYQPTEPELAALAEEQDLGGVFARLGHTDMRALWFYRGDGCDACTHTGYAGRIGIFEVMELAESLRTLVVERVARDKLAEAARALGMTTMLEDGIAKALSGVTTLEEVIRVTRE